nr:PREDICTED: P2X purinoceptor 3 [Lepisosteus oculatus]
MNCVKDFFTYETTKSVVVKSWTIGIINRVVQLLIITYFIGDPMMEAENFTIFIKNSIRFPMFNFTKGNFLPNITKTYIKTCNFHPVEHRYCPIFRLGDVLKFAHQDFYALASQVQLCARGYAKYYKMENGTEYRTLLKAYAIRFDVLVYGNVGKFNMIPTLINIVAAFTSVGVGTVLCDIILLNFLKGAEQYKAKKFEEVSEHQIRSTMSNSNDLYKSNQTLSFKYDEKQSTDSGAFSIGL